MIAATKFAGSKSGYVFKMGAAGLGYYPDKKEDGKVAVDRVGKRRRLEKGTTAGASAAAEQETPQQAFVTEDNRSGPMPRYATHWVPLSPSPKDVK